MLNRSYISAHQNHPHHLFDKDLNLLRGAFKNFDKSQDITPLLKNLSDSTKLSIYLLLHKVDEISVTDICLILDLSQSSVSHALSDLKKLDLVKCNRCGQLKCYSLKKQSRRRTSFLSIFKKFLI